MRFLLNSVWGIYIVYVTELFPSEITSIAMGYLNAVGAVAAAASPYIKLANKGASMTVMAVMAFMASAHLFCLQETKGLPQRQRILEREGIVEEFPMVHHQQQELQ